MSYHRVGMRESALSIFIHPRAGSLCAPLFFLLACWVGASPLPLLGQTSQNFTPLAPQAVAVLNFQELADREALSPPQTSPHRVIPRPGPVPWNRTVRLDAPRTSEKVSLPIIPSAQMEPSLAATFFFVPALDDDNTVIPPDTNGAVSLRNAIVMLNSQVRIQDRTGAPLSTVSLGSFWAPTGATNVFDPRVQYDTVANRWIVAATSDPDSPNSSVLLGASQTDDPTANWSLYRFRADSMGMNWADFPYLGYDPNWVLVPTNIFTNVTDRFVGARLFLVTKSDLYAGGDVIARTAFTPTAFSLAPATSLDSGSTTFFMAEDLNGNFMGNGFLGISTITGPVGAETFTENAGIVAVTSTWQDFVVGDFLPQMGSSRRIDAGDARMGNCVLRFGSLWCAHTVFLPAAGPTRSSAQWWQIDSATFAVQQFGRVDDSSGTKFFAYPSIAVNSNQDVVIGYSRFGADQFASANFSSRAGTDPPGTLQADTVFMDGQAPYVKTFGGPSNRWGDYSATMVDPLDDLGFWTIQESAAMPTGGSDRWRTTWGIID